MNVEERWHQLIALYQTGQISDSEFAELEETLKESKEARALFHRLCRMDSLLRREAENSDGGEERADEKVISPVFRPMAWLVAAAVVVLAVVVTWTQVSKPEVIATLESAENAAWESSLPTEPGSELTEGYLKLTTGIATIRFRSGAEVVLEAPAHLILETEMRGRLLAGAAVIEVPESAIGFVMEAPGGYAVDFGTQFAVSADGVNGSSDFEVLKGEIAVHHPATGKEVRLTNRQGASLSGEAMVTYDGKNEEPTFAEPSRPVRIGTNGRADYVIRNNKRGKHIHPEMLMVKQRGADSGIEESGHNWDMRAFFSFEISEIELEKMASARVRLNLVPSGNGLAARLPLVNTFAIYGVTRPGRETWGEDPRWEESPSPEDGVLLGKFDIPRSQQNGSVGIGSAELMEFLKADADGRVTFVIVRETGLIDGEGKGLFHAFASDAHPEANGPALEFVMQAPSE